MRPQPDPKSDGPGVAPLEGPARRRGPARIALWALQGLAAAAFLAAGALKLAGDPMMVDIFARIGLGQGFRVVTGLVEVAGGLMLLAPGLAGVGGLLLAITMVCALLTHLLVIGGDPTPAAALLVVTGIIAWARRKATVALVLRRR